MNTLTIALLQISPTYNLHANLNKGINACLAAKLGQADLALFPEMYSNGCSIYDRSFDQWKDDAISIDSNFVKNFQALAKQLDMAIGITILEKIPYSKYPQNTMVLFDRYGRRMLTYAKVHTNIYGQEKYLSTGDDFFVCNLDTAHGVVKVGAMIGDDMWLPESARILMLKGAEVILVPNAGPMEINRLSLLRCRSFENMISIATCNYTIGVAKCNGQSSIFNGIVASENSSKNGDLCILQSPEQEGIYIATINLDDLRECRTNEVHPYSYRQPKKYHLLTQEL